MTAVLVVDDDPGILRTLGINLRARDYEVELVADGRTALQAFADAVFDVVLVDLGLPDIGGVDVIRQVRATSTVPIVVLSARHESDDKVEALDAGADDYVTKPFGMDELLARVRAAARRGGTQARQAPIEAGELWIDVEDRRVERGGEMVHLTPTEWRLVEVLLEHPGRLVRQGHLLRTVWGPASERDTNYLRVYLGRLRRKLEVDPSRPDHFVTEPGLGVRFVP
ncbi:MAG: response regulator transcription factor [Nocardioidaceae bacterium]|nr:response regulator transcription factor [Nocardioidaceae bacterium]